MNNTRRREIRNAVDQIKEQLQVLQQLQEEEVEAFENLPESIQYSEKGEAMETCAEEIQSMIDNIESECDEVDNILES